MNCPNTHVVGRLFNAFLYVPSGKPTRIIKMNALSWYLLLCRSVGQLSHPGDYESEDEDQGLQQSTNGIRNLMIAPPANEQQAFATSHASSMYGDATADEAIDAALLVQAKHPRTAFTTDVGTSLPGSALNDNTGSDDTGGNKRRVAGSNMIAADPVPSAAAEMMALARSGRAECQNGNKSEAIGAEDWFLVSDTLLDR